MARTKTALPLASYAAEYFMFYEKALRDESLQVVFDNPRDAHILRHRLHRLRKTMLEQGHHLGKPAYKISLSIQELPNGQTAMIAELRDQEMVEKIREALGDDYKALEEYEELGDTVEDFLKDFMRE